MTLNKILESLEEASESKREKGSKFEKLMKNWFLTTKLYADNIKNIWLWNEFPYRNQFGGSDSGIDLVIYNEEDEFVAIQCKFYSPNAEISKSDVDTFISTSAKLFEVNGEMKKFLGRIFVSTTNKWSKNANDLIKNQEIPVIRLSLNEFENSDVDWSKIYLGKLGNEAKKEGKTIRKHQKEARDSVHEYFKENNRGKLIMACGTGKTFTSLKIAENETNKNGLILFLVPSIALLGQTLREWTNDVDNDTKLYPICICSDSKISSKKSTNDDNVISVVDLALPATTDTDKIVNQLKKIKDKKGMKVVFSTYQSIDVIAGAQKKILEQDKNFGKFDLIICDEAHRTTGVTLKNEDESNFVKVHSNEFLKAKKRLYMTATPRLYDDNSKSKAKESEAYLCSMDNKELYGEEIYRIGFGKAVENNLLTDYKVLILTLNSSQIPTELQSIIANGEKEFNFDDATRLIGCINGLSKQILDKEKIIKSTDPEPMKRAVAFCRDIKTSKKITSSFNDYSEDYISSLKEEAKTNINISFGVGMRAAVNSNFKPATSVELAFIASTRIHSAKRLYLQYGFSVVGESLNIKNNKYFVLDNEVTKLVPYERSLDVSRLRTSYFTLIAGVEKKFPSKIRIGAGGYFGSLINAKQRVKYGEGDKDYDVWLKHDIKANPLTYGLSAHIGYGIVALYAKYSLAPLFKNSPDNTYPFVIGLKFW